MERMSHGLHLIDTGYLQPELAGSWLLVHRGRAAFVETGTNVAVPACLAALDELGLAPDAVDWVIVTHVHLDHAGGAGALLRHLPAARLVVHPRGARHLVDPSRLMAGASKVYDPAWMARWYGELVPVPEERVLTPADGQGVDLAGRPLVALHTPGHAAHHLAIWDAASRGVFTGDVFGLGYRPLHTPRGAFVFPTTSPSQFDAAAMRSSVDRILALNPDHLYLTHYGAVGDAARHGRRVHALLDEWLAARDAVVREVDQADRETRLTALLRTSLRAFHRAEGGDLPDSVFDAWTAMDLRIDAQGLLLGTA